MAISARDLEDLLRSLLPAGDTRFELGLAGDAAVIEHEDGALAVRVRLATFEPDDDHIVRDVKEQELRFLTAAQRADPKRVAAYVRAWTGALAQIVDRQYGGDIDACMPCDLLFSEALATDARELDDFRALFASAETLARWQVAGEEAEFDHTLEHFGLGAFKAGLRALRRPSIRLVVDRDEDEDDGSVEDEQYADHVDEEIEDSPIGASRIGGLPDLPPGAAWPRLEGAALSFLAQIDLGELHRYPGAEALPAAGLLMFFHDADGRTNRDEHGTWAWPVRHRGGVQVLHLDNNDPAGLVRTAAPADDPTLRIFPVYEVRPVSERMMPAMESPFYEALDPDSVHDAQWYSRFSRAVSLDESDRERPVHRLLGYPSELQGDPYLEAHLYASGQDFGADWQRDGARERALQREATRWRLLLQIDSEPGNTLLSQDGGFFYFMIHEDDLAAGRFDRAWGIAHGH